MKIKLAAVNNCFEPVDMDTIAKNKWKELLALAKAGDPEAQWQVGYYYEFGAVDGSGIVLTKSDLLKAHRWYKLSAEQGSTSGQVAMSNLFSTGDGLPRDFKTAIYWAKKAIAQGEASAVHNLGNIYRDQGKPAMAFRCYRRAASMRHNDSLLEVGLCYLFGIGTKQDFGDAYSSLNKIITGDPSASCDRTKENALYWMAVIELSGKGKTKRSVARARKMLETANADQDHEQANEILNLIGKCQYLSA
jgi:TPR repeat protein